jgi:hypothetical protein
LSLAAKLHHGDNFFTARAAGHTQDGRCHTKLPTNRRSHATGGGAVAQLLWEAAIDYWRLHRRMSTHFEALGDLGAAVMYHVHAILVILPCAEQGGLLVVCIASHRSVQWRQWQQRIRELGARLTQGR